MKSCKLIFSHFDKKKICVKIEHQMYNSVKKLNAKSKHLKLDE